LIVSLPEIDPPEIPPDPDEGDPGPPLSGTVDDDDNRDDERPEENEAPVRESRDSQELPEEFQLDEREEDPQDGNRE
jgi:hypothetical protein